MTPTRKRRLAKVAREVTAIEDALLYLSRQSLPAWSHGYAQRRFRSLYYLSRLARRAP